MTHHPTLPPKARPGDRVAVVSPSYAAPTDHRAVHEQAMQRLADLTGLVPVEYPSTRAHSSPRERARDLDAAFADPDIRAVLSTIGGDDQITVIPHLDAEAVRRDPKPFLGYSDNTNLLAWLWSQGVAAFHGGSTQVHLGPGPAVDEVHAASLRAALLKGGTLEITEPGESEDFGRDWLDPAALTAYGERVATEPWSWHGPARRVSGRTWGGCLEVFQWILAADRFPHGPEALAGAVLLVETSEALPSAAEVGYILRSMGERGLLSGLAGVVAARPATSTQATVPSERERAQWRADQRDAVVSTVHRYNADAVVCVGVPFGHTRPQWILPYGGTLTLDGEQRRVFASYD